MKKKKIVYRYNWLLDEARKGIVVLHVNSSY
jgi:hypothetical protein